MDDDAECGSRNVVEFVARDRDRATRALSPRARRATCAPRARTIRFARPRTARRSTRATPNPETPSRAATRDAARDAGAALVFMVFRVLFTRSFGSLQYDHVDTQS
jgi:hypothetical protein